MSRHAKRPLVPPDDPAYVPTIDLCLFHRCPAHEGVKQLNQHDNDAECGACVAADVAQLEIYNNKLRRMLHSAKERLNILSPGAGDFIDEDDTKEMVN